MVVIHPRPIDAAPDVCAIKEAAVLGRGLEATVRLLDPRLSRAHASVEPACGGFVVKDLGSRHGSFVNGVPTGAQGLKAAYGDVVRVGDTILLAARDVEPFHTVARRIPAKVLHLRRDVIAGPSFAQALDHAARVGQVDHPALILGESGTGKEAIARMIHASRERPGPFVAINIAAIPPSLFEAELFGHERGAFTGALGARAGAFREADGGLLFLDEVADLSIDLQVKLLRVIDTQQVRPVGASADVPIDVRVVTATSRDLREACTSGTFRPDLYYRLAGVVVHVPPLRERRDEILLLALTMFEEEGAGQRLSANAAEILALASWKGNVRNLRRVVTHAAAEARAAERLEILACDLPDLSPIEPAPEAGGALTADRVRVAMTRAGGVASRAAHLLGVSRSTFYNVCKRLGIEASSLRDT